MFNKNLNKNLNAPPEPDYERPNKSGTAGVVRGEIKRACAEEIRSMTPSVLFKVISRDPEVYAQLETVFRVGGMNALRTYIRNLIENKITLTIKG